MALKKIAPKLGETKSRTKRNKQPTQHSTKGVRHKILGANGKIRWEWKP